MYSVFNEELKLQSTYCMQPLLYNMAWDYVNVFVLSQIETWIKLLNTLCYLHTINFAHIEQGVYFPLSVHIS